MEWNNFSRLRVHMVGIGGAGMAALALMLREMGCQVSGSDRARSDNARRLEAVGIPVVYSHDPRNVDGADVCVYSAAVPADHPQLVYARARMPVLTRAQLMGQLSRRFARVAAVAGTHGKTTTSAMLTHILRLDGQDPSALIGGFVPSLGGNGKLGGTDLLVCEACEFAGTFLQLKRDVGVLLNVDRDHLECYGSLEGLHGAFARFADGCGTLLVCGDDPAALAVSQKHPHRLRFGLEENNDYRARNVTQDKGFYTFTLQGNGLDGGPVTLRIPGRHNVTNALAAIGAAHQLGASPAAIQKGAASFTGVARRFEVLLRTDTVTVADDYAHHPAEIEAVLSAAGAMGFSRITAVFQPFTYSRTADLREEFIRVLSKADRVILPPIMGGREADPHTVRSEDLAKGLHNAVVCPDLTACAAEALRDLRPGELVLTMGCGNVYLCAREMVRRLSADV